MKLERRKFNLCAGGLLAGLLQGGRALCNTIRKKPRVGLQLYSVRHLCQKDLPGVLKAVAEMGYEGVEFAGFYGYSAEDLRELLEKNGLVCCGSHTPWNDLSEQRLQQTIEFNRIIGNRYLIVPWLPEKERNSVEAVKKTAEKFNQLARAVAPHGMYVGYHCHAGDFNRIDHTTAWELLFRQTRPEVIMQLDTGNCLQGGGDPYALLRQFPGRAVTIHLKEYGGPADAVVGEGQVRWNEIVKLCETVGGTEWYIIEHERSDKDPLEAVRRCLVNLRRIMEAT